MAGSIELSEGILIVLEGIDGAGKTTQINRLAEVYEGEGFAVVVGKEPTDQSRWGIQIRSSARDGRLGPEEETEAFIADRRQHVAAVIRPALEAGKIVLLDRYYLSTVAYQGVRGIDPVGLLERNEEFAPQPDVAVILEVSPEVGLSRIASRGDSQTHFERRELLARSAELFRAIDRGYILRLDGTLAIEEITTAILEHVAQGPLLRARR